MAQNKLPSLDKSGSDSKTETEHTVKLDTKKNDLYHYPVQMIKIWKNKNQQTLRSKQMHQHMMIKVVQL